ncbi:MAG: hypothetical protein LUE29_09815 [Lachnospiraceae bacterium]|nr:hypothetical protein [Lachnospiraceae bacterium]
MAVLKWDQTGERLFETGVNKGVLFPFVDNAYGTGVAWNGLTAVNENPSGAELTALYADNIKYLNLMSAEDFGGTIEVYTYPDEFGQCDGTASLVTGVTLAQQKRIPFGFSYQTRIGNDTDGSDYGYKIHLVYGAIASPSQKGYNTINDSPEAITFSWEFSTTPVEVSGFKPTAHIVIDSTKVTTAQLTAIETALYGSTSAESYLPLPDALATMFAA